MPAPSLRDRITALKDRLFEEADTITLNDTEEARREEREALAEELTTILRDTESA